MQVFTFRSREQPGGARLCGNALRLTPECATFEWALFDVNKSGTAEVRLAFVSCLLQGTGAFLYPSPAQL